MRAVLKPIGRDKNIPRYQDTYARVHTGSQAGNNYCHTAPFFPPAIRRFLACALRPNSGKRGLAVFSHTVVIALDWLNNSGYAAIDLSLFYQHPIFFSIFSQPHSATVRRNLFADNVFFQYDLIVVRVAKFVLARSFARSFVHAAKRPRLRFTSEKQLVQRARTRSISDSRRDAELKWRGAINELLRHHAITVFVTLARNIRHS